MYNKQFKYLAAKTSLTLIDEVRDIFSKLSEVVARGIVLTAGVNPTIHVLTFLCYGTPKALAPLPNNLQAIIGVT